MLGALLIALMAIGSIALWVAIPIIWLWLGSQLQTGSAPGLGPYAVIIIGIPVSMVLMSRLLGILNRKYGEVSGTATEMPFRSPWLRSLRGERNPERPRTVLDLVMVISVSLAVVSLIVWFFAFAGSSLPG